MYQESIKLQGKAVHLASSDAPEATTIEDQRFTSVITCDSGEGENTIIEGFTNTGGDAMNGGVFALNASPTIKTCTIKNNGAGSGGGMYIENGSPLVENTTIRDNFSDSPAGGVRNVAASPTCATPVKTKMPK